MFDYDIACSTKKKLTPSGVIFFGGDRESKASVPTTGRQKQCNALFLARALYKLIRLNTPHKTSWNFSNAGSHVISTKSYCLHYGLVVEYNTN